jgi:hypothetical protein
VVGWRLGTVVASPRLCLNISAVLQHVPLLLPKRFTNGHHRSDHSCVWSKIPTTSSTCRWSRRTTRSALSGSFHIKPNYTKQPTELLCHLIMRDTRSLDLLHLRLVGVDDSTVSSSDYQPSWTPKFGGEAKQGCMSHGQNFLLDH